MCVSLSVLALQQISGLSRFYSAVRPIVAGIGSNPNHNPAVVKWKRIDQWMTIWQTQNDVRSLSRGGLQRCLQICCSNGHQKHFQKFYSQVECGGLISTVTSDRSISEKWYMLQRKSLDIFMFSASTALQKGQKEWIVLNFTWNFFYCRLCCITQFSQRSLY